MQFLTDESGATSIEYALIAAFLAMVIVGGVIFLGNAATAPFQTIAGAL